MKYWLPVFLLLLQTGMVFAGIWDKTHFINREQTIDVAGEDKLIIRQTDEIIIADEDGKSLGYDGVRETDFRKLRNLYAIIYDSTGSVIRKLKKDDIMENTVSYSAVYSEHKDKFHNLSYPSLPYRIISTIEYEIKSAFFWPDWDPQASVDVQGATLEVRTDGEVPFEYILVGQIDEPCIYDVDDDSKRYVWHVENIQAFQTEYHRAPEATFQVGVRFRPMEFELDGHTGSNQSWTAFGDWYYSLLQDRLDLSAAEPFTTMLSTLSGPRERIRTLYRFLQQKTRYVQIYLGIDGWRPHPVDKIHETKYGDCKDLSVYMMAMLKQAGIESFPALVRTRSDGWVDPDIPGNQFNHFVAMVPVAADTFWLECTSDMCSFDDPPWSIEGVNVLLIRPNGSQIIRTPLSSAEANRFVFTGTAKFESDRSLSLSGNLTWTGNLAIDMRSRLSGLDLQKRREWLSRQFSGKAGDVRVERLDVFGLENPDTTLSIDFGAKLAYFARRAGSRMIFEPSLYHKVTFEGESPDGRTMPLYNHTRYVYLDSLRFELPAGFTLRGGEQDDELTSRFGDCSMALVQTPDGIVWKSWFRQNSREVSLDDYADYYAFMVGARELSNKKVVLQKNN